MRSRKLTVPKTVQATMPFETLFLGGLIQVDPMRYARIAMFQNVNYTLAKVDEQSFLFSQYSEWLNSLDQEIHVQLFLSTYAIDPETVWEAMAPLEVDPKYAELASDYERVMHVQVQESHHQTSEKRYYVVISVEAKDPDHADQRLSRVMHESEAHFQKMGSSMRPVGSEQVVQLLYGLYNMKEEHTQPLRGNETAIGRGASVKDKIAPPSFKFKINHVHVGETFARTLFVRDFPSSLNDAMIASLVDCPFTLSVAIHIQPTDSADAIRLIKKKITGMESNKLDYIRKGARISPHYQFVPYELQTALEEAQHLLNQIVKENKKLFFVGIYLTVFADSLDELDGRTKTVQSICRRFLTRADVLTHQQEDGLASVLPFGKDKIGNTRTMLTDSTAIFLPFSTQDVFQPGGFCYGRNRVSGSLIVFNRKQLQNASGFILGVPGSGKSFRAKREIVDVLLNTGDDVIVIDPEREYSTLCENFGGEVIRIASNSSHTINPMDMSKDYADDDNPLTVKAEFILSLCESLMGSLKPSEKTIIDRAILRTYSAYLSSDFDEAKIPTLHDFYETVCQQPEEEAKNIALALEIYIKGSLNIFSKRTNINLNNRFTVFDTKDLGKQLKSLGMLVVLDAVWNRVCKNRNNGKYTWIYTDEFYLLFSSEYSANFYYELYKRARKWGGIPTGITQNIEDLLRSDTARTMLSNSQFLLLLNQAASDRQELSKLLKISSMQLSFVTNADEGCGLLISTKHVIPFQDRFPKDNRLYRMMTTKVDELRVGD